MERDLFKKINEAGIEYIAEKLGLEVKKNPLSFGPCPSCGSKQRHTKRKDPRLACNIVYGGYGFFCIQCGMKGDAVILLAIALNNGHKPRTSAEWRNVRSRAQEALNGWGATSPLPRLSESLSGQMRASEGHPRLMSRPPFPEILGLWERSSPIPPNEESIEFLKEKFPSYSVDDLLDLDIARWLPRQNLPEWWPWSRFPYMAVLAFNAKGMVQSVHGRVSIPKDKLGDAPKTRWPKGYSASELLLANKSAVAWLRGKAETPAVIVSEGITSTIAASMFLRKSNRWKWSVLGVTSGSANAFKGIEFPEGLDVFIWTDSDSTGEGYCNKIASVLPNHVHPKRVRL